MSTARTNFELLLLCCYAAAEMNGDVVVRRATVDDCDAVLNITDDDLWDGNDYLPSLYHVFLQTKRHVFYVAEINGRLVKIQQMCCNV